MDKLLLENYSLINKIKAEYDFLLKENKLLKEKIYVLEDIGIGKDIITNKLFSENGVEAVKELLELLELLEKSGYIIKVRSNGLWYTIYKQINKCFIIENYNKGRAYHGLITTYYQESYTEKDNNIINNWEYYGRSKTRKKYDYRGRNKKEILNMIEGLLS